MTIKRRVLAPEEYDAYLGEMCEDAAHNRSDVLAHIEFAYENYEKFIDFCEKRIKGKKLRWEK